MTMLCLVQVTAFAQSPVTGKVTATGSGEGLPGVSVVVKGTTIGSATSVDGSYSIEAPANSTLVFSYIGFVGQEVAVNNRSVVNVQLVPDTKALDEVVVVGYGTQKRGDITGAITSVGAKDFNKGVVVSPQQLIQGRAAGVNVTPSSGRPGGASTIRIRGGTSISAGNEPLYVVDGVPLQLSNASRQSNIGGSGGNMMIFNQEPVNPLNSINPSDIESMEILKDASATAIYGSRGANGVVIITTKKGKQGSMSTTYDTYAGVSKVAKTLDVLSADEYRQFMKDNNITNFTDKGASTDWQDQIFRTAYSQNHNLAVSGGTENTSYRASVGYISQQGIIISSGIDNYTGRVNINHKALDKKLSIDLNLGGAVVEEDNAPISSALGGEGGNILKDALRFNPTYPVYDEKGNYSQINQFIINPVSYAEQIEDMRTTRRNLGNISTTYNIWGPLSVNVNLGYTYENIKGNAYVPRANPLGQGVGGLANTQASEHWSKLLETTLIFKHDINANNRIDAVGGYSYQYFIDEGYRNRVQGFVSDEFKYYNIGAASQRLTTSSYRESSKLISFYGRVNYSLLDRYLVTLTVRRDGSSRFGSGNKWGVFPSGSVAWRVSNEDFFPKTNLVSDLKLRVSYGITGNQEIGNLLSLPTLGATSATYNIGGSPITIVSPERYANPDLKWEETAQFNIGTDFQLFKGRVYGSLDYYHKNTTDLLLSFNIPSPSVVTTQLANVGEVENKGVELALGGYVFDKADFQWKVDLNWSRNRNKVISLSNDQWSTKILQNYELSGFGFTGINSQAIIPGQPLGNFYGLRYIGTENGIEQYADVNGNGRFNQTEDVEIIGNTQPDFTFGITNTFNYKRFDLSFMLRGSQGNDVLNNTALDLQRKNILPGQNILKGALNDGLGNTAAVRYSSRWIEDGSFIRLDNLTLGYNFNISRFPVLKNARVYVTGQNLFLITDYTGLDPEVISSISGIGESPRGIDYMTYPRARTYMLGASITF
ncbi:SusC/RagA family TonB-linked outer membrane protein [Rufibacter tibetensis]|uniref:SusC/RagA family TonB-linked outer membrane protein n=2 Tax=Rufibacter tibetensis TaxID=512763 RepID=A0A0P0C3Z9_9BACT|nr:SusC/RagA family TonB-linked outer membrane protein [Rufibacter tibetensis]